MGTTGFSTKKRKKERNSAREKGDKDGTYQSHAIDHRQSGGTPSTPSWCPKWIPTDTILHKVDKEERKGKERKGKEKNEKEEEGARIS